MSQENIIIVGGKGLLGSSLLCACKEISRPISVGYGKENEIIIDVLSLEQWIKLIEDTRPSKIINTYAYADVDGCESNIDLAYKLNSLVPAVIQAAVELSQYNIHVIHISTDQIYSGSRWYRESTIPKPLNYYGKTKLLGEKHLDMSRSTILRTNFFGRSKSSKKSSYTDWIYKSIKGGGDIYLNNDVYFNPIHMVQLAKITLIIMEMQLTGVFNVGANTKMSKFEFALKFAELIGLGTETIKASRYEQKKHQIERPTDMSLDTRKLIEATGVELMSLEKNIELCCNEYR